MVTTHVLAGAALAGVAAVFAPALAPAALAGGVAGGLFPDLDLYAGHRRTLHYPVYYPLAAGVAVALAVLAPSSPSAAVAAFLAAAGCHCVMDAGGGGLELRPWRGTSDRAVYDHHRGRWVQPRRWVRYDGAPEDAALAWAFGGLVLVAFGAGVLVPVVAVLAASTCYAALRKPLAGAVEYVVALLPAPVVTALPPRFVDGPDGAGDVTRR